MNHIIHIDTATETAFVSIAVNGQVLHTLQNESQKDHGAFVQTAVAKLLQQAGTSMAQTDAIAVTAGPGSYTGLRVGMASAKGLSYALQKPLITIGTLELWARAAIAQQPAKNDDHLFCPMIDARRMEVFTAVYTSALTPVMAPAAMILSSHSFTALLDDKPIIFTGNGAAKWQAQCIHPNATFTILHNLPAAMAHLSYTAFLQHQFANLAYTEPFYLKEFQNNI